MLDPNAVIACGTQMGSRERPRLFNPESSGDWAENRRAKDRSSFFGGISTATSNYNMAILFASLRLCVRLGIGPNDTFSLDSRGGNGYFH